MSNFPSSLDNDSTLYIAKDNISTTLLAAMAIGDTVAVLKSPTGWVANMIATCESEQMLVTAVVGNVATVTRAFGGTSAAAHASGKAFANNVDAAYQAAAKAAIIAIETALGANLANVAAPTSLITSSAFNFAAQSPGGSLALGSNVIALNPLPVGLAVGNTLYIAGGTGTAEAATISAVGGGSVTVTCNHTHSGAWTIQSATAGIQEALQSKNGGRLYIPTPSGRTEIFCYSTIKVPDNYDWEIFGDGDAYAAYNAQTVFPQTTLRAIFNGAPLLQASAAAENTRNIHIHDLSLVGGISADPADTGDGLSVTNYLRVVIQRVHCSRFDGNGIKLHNSYGAYLQNVFSIENGLCGLLVDGASAALVTALSSQFVTNGDKGGALVVNANIAASGALALTFLNCNFEGPGAHALNAVTDAYGLNVGVGNPVQLLGCYFDAPIGNGDDIILQNGVQPFDIRACWIGGTNGVAHGIQIVQDAPTGAIQNNVFDMAGARAIYTPYDTGGRHQLEIYPNLYQAGATCTFGSALLSVQGNGWWKTSAPTAGTWLVGDKVYNPSPALGGYTGLICTVAGSPGTWAPFGFIGQSPFYIASETGANNAIVAALPAGATLATGLILQIKLGHTLQAGANTLNGVALKSSRNPANNIGTAYAATGTICVVYDSTGPYYLDLSQ